jgi:putative ABC transport system permease protein
MGKNTEGYFHFKKSKKIMITNYLKIAWRSLWKNKSTSFINITGLSVGMAAAVLIMLWVQNELSFDNYHQDADRIYNLTAKIPDFDKAWENTPLLLADAAKKEVPEIEKITKLFVNNWPVFNINDKLFYQKKCAYVDEEWFNLFHYDFIEGNNALFNQNPFSIILTASEAKKYFNTHSAVGSTIRIDSVAYQVAGVVADAPSNSSFQFDAFIPITALLTNPQRRANDMDWQNYNYLTFIKLSPERTPSRLSRDVPSVTASKLTNIMKTAKQEGATIGLTPLLKMHFDTNVEYTAFLQGNRNTIYVFSIIAFLLLLIACINYVNLATAKSSLRAKEVSVRKIVGAKRSHLFFQFITEYVFISLLSLITTLLLVQFCLPVFNAVTDKHFVLPFSSIKMWGIIGITLITALLLNSIYPAILLSSFQPLNVFRGKTVLKFKDVYLRKGLVVLQFTVSVILVASTFIIYRQMQFIQESNPGYNRSQVLNFALPPSIRGAERTRLMKTMKQALNTESPIQGVTFSNQPLVNIGSWCTECVDWKGRDPNFKPRVAQLSTDEDCLNTMQLHMAEGQWFQKDRSTDKHNVILNETAVRELQLSQPIVGHDFIFKGDTGQVIGVVKDFNYKSLHEKSGAVVIFNRDDWQNHIMVRIAPQNIAAGVAVVEKTWKTHLPNTPLEYKFLDDTFNELYKEDRKSASLILAFALIAVFISALGLFGLAAFMAEQRTKEIGIRKVLGATVPNIITLLSKDFIVLVSIAIIVATPLAWWAMSIWLQNFAYRINIVWWMFAVTGVLALVIALLTVSFQAVKAAVANPVKSLRTE